MNVRAGMVLLLEPIISWGTIQVLRKVFEGKTLLTYLTVVSALALTLGYWFSMI